MKKLFLFLLVAMMIGLLPTHLAYAGTDLYNDGAWQITSDKDLKPITTAVSDIGDATHYVGNAYITTGYVTTSVLGGAVSIVGDITPTTSHNVDIGSATYEIGGVYADGATLDSVVATTADINGGTLDGATVGATSASSGAFTTLAYSGVLSPGTGSSALTNYEVFTTGDTLTAADSGKVLITNLYDTDGIVDFILPVATTAGIEYTFVSEQASIIRIDPAGSATTDRIMYASLAQGDRIASGTALASAGASGDSITLVSTGTGWAITEMVPIDWADAN